MKKLIYIFLPFLCILYFRIPVHAELIPVNPQLPSVIPQNQQLMVMDFSQQAPTAYFNSSGMLLMGDNGFYDVLEIYSEQYDLPTDYKWTTKPLSETLWKPSANLYDSQGNLVNAENASLCYGGNSYGNTYFLFDNSSGDILSIGESPESAISSVNSTVNNKFWGVVGELAENMFGATPKPVCFFDEQEKTSSEVESLLNLPNSYICVTQNGYDAPWYLMCPDVNNPHVYSTGDAIYCDDIGLDMCSYGQTSRWNGSNSTKFPVSEGHYIHNGVDYPYRLPAYGRIIPGPYDIAKRPSTDPSLVNNNSTDVIWYTPTEQYDLPDTYNYTYHNTRNISYNRTFNNEYNTNNYTTYNNYPISTTINNLPDFSPTYNYYYEYNNYVNTPQIGESLGEQQQTLPDNIPILSQLEKRFPFSIPFDIYKMLKGFAVQRQTPYIDTYLTIPAVNYEWHIQYDLHDFDDLASLSRTLLLIGYIIGLAYFSYDHFFGS